MLFVFLTLMLFTLTLQNLQFPYFSHSVAIKKKNEFKMEI